MRSIPENQPPFQSFGEQLIAVVETVNSGRRDPRLMGVQRRAEIAFQAERRGPAAGGSEMIPSDGGFLVAPEFSRDLMQRVYLTGDIIKRCFRVPVNSSSYKFPQLDESSRVDGSRLGGVQVYSEQEGASLLPTGLQSAGASMKPTFGQPTVAVNKITGLLRLTDELARDTNAFSTWASYAFATELTYKLESLHRQWRRRWHTDRTAEIRSPYYDGCPNGPGDAQHCQPERHRYACQPLAGIHQECSLALQQRRLAVADAASKRRRDRGFAIESIPLRGG